MHFIRGKESMSMGKNTGFLEFERRTSQTEEPLQRIQYFNEFHIPLTEEEQREQGARCMDCGVPFCQEMCIRDRVLPIW